MEFNSTTSSASEKVEAVMNFKKEDKKAVVLTSGGLDSLVTLKYAIERFGADNVTALDFFYNQNHAGPEMSCSDKICKRFGIGRETFDISEIFKFSDSAMLKPNKDKIIHKSYEEQIYGEGGTGERHCVSTYCPNRNAILINIAAAFAISIGAEYVLIGAHADDAAGNAYADTSKAFIEKEAAALAEGTDPSIKLVAPLVDLSKKENVALGIKLGLTEDDFAMSFSCYDPIEVEPGKYKACISNGVENCCATCKDRYNALVANGIDPRVDTIYG